MADVPGAGRQGYRRLQLDAAARAQGNAEADHRQAQRRGGEDPRHARRQGALRRRRRRDGRQHAGAARGTHQGRGGALRRDRPEDQHQTGLTGGSVMRIRAPKDFWSGLLFMVIAAAFIGLSQQYKMGDMHRMGPALFPTLVGALLAVLGAVITLRAFVVDGPPVPRFHARPLLVSLAAIALFGVVLSYLGLVTAIVLLVLVGA